VDWLSGCAWLVRSQAIEAIGPMDEGYFMYFEDVDYCRRANDAGWCVLAVPEVTLQHHINQGLTVLRRTCDLVAIPGDQPQRGVEV
jgi:GT2 family glycosyltransferase